ncbi:hypothetical protein D3C78_1483840 [compost metagenome]
MQNTLRGYLRANFAKMDYSRIDVHGIGMYEEEIELHKQQVEAIQLSALTLDMDFQISWRKPAEKVGKKITPRVVEFVNITPMTLQEYPLSYTSMTLPF